VEKQRSIGQSKQLVIEVSVSEVDVNDIEIGQPVNITFDAIPNKEYQGMVTGISQAGDDHPA
jgi:multidrug resistance efflux pump